jgi:hypothetical protein
VRFEILTSAGVIETQGDRYEISDGYLHLVDLDGAVCETYAPGMWSYVRRFPVDK